MPYFPPRKINRNGNCVCCCLHAGAEYVFSPSSSSSTADDPVEHRTAVTSGRNALPRLARNQIIGGEMLAIGRRLAGHAGVQAAVVEDLWVRL